MGEQVTDLNQLPNISSGNFAPNDQFIKEVSRMPKDQFVTLMKKIIGNSTVKRRQAVDSVRNQLLNRFRTAYNDSLSSYGEALKSASAIARSDVNELLDF